MSVVPAIHVNMVDWNSELSVLMKKVSREDGIRAELILMENAEVYIKQRAELLKQLISRIKEVAPRAHRWAPAKKQAVLTLKAALETARKQSEIEDLKTDKTEIDIEIDPKQLQNGELNVLIEAEANDKINDNNSESENTTESITEKDPAELGLNSEEVLEHMAEVDSDNEDEMESVMQEEEDEEEKQFLEENVAAPDSDSQNDISQEEEESDSVRRSSRRTKAPQRFGDEYYKYYS
ncbi:hypothetical protein ACHWQZ_G013504 [Mnemiopsis leidyi]